MTIFNQELVSKHYPECAMMPEAMRVWSLPKGKEGKLQEMCENGQYFAQIKKDGFWYQFIKGETTSYLFSRNTSVATGLLTEKLDNAPHIKQALSVLPKDTILIGEVYVPGGTSKDTTRIMGCLPAEAIKRQEAEGYVHYYVHDVIAFNGNNLMELAAEKRYEILKGIFDNFNLANNSFIELAEKYEDNIFELIGQALENGEEGMVLKRRDYAYVPGKKPAWSAIKCKKVDYADVVCMGFEDATKVYDGKELETWQYWIIEKCSKLGENDFVECERHMGDVKDIKNPLYRTVPVTKPYFYNWKTSIRIGAFDKNGVLKEIGTCSSGITDELRRDFAENPDKYIGKTMLAQCMEKDNKAQTLRHPIFKGFRIDKDAKECTLEEIFS